MKGKCYGFSGYRQTSKEGFVHLKCKRKKINTVDALSS